MALSNTVLVRLVSFIGLLTSFYALHVESQLDDPFYVPACNSAIFGGSCAQVFKSSYAHILSHWGLVEKDSIWDLSLAVTGIILYVAYFIAISLPFRIPGRETLFLTVASTGRISIHLCLLSYLCLFSLY